MPSANIYGNVKQALQDIVAPELRALQVEIKRLDEKIDGMDKRITARIEEMDKRLNDKIGGLKEQFALAIDIHERLAAVEAKLGH